MFILKFFSGRQPESSVPTYRAMCVDSYEISPPFGPQRESGQWATVVMHRLDGSTVDWSIKHEDYLIVENIHGTTVDKVRRMGTLGTPSET